MALAAVRNIKTMLVGQPLTVAAPDKLVALWQACPFVDRVLPLADPKDLWETARQLRRGEFSSAVLFTNSFRTAAEAVLAGIPQRIGYARNSRRLLLTHPFAAPARNPIRLHQRYYYLDLITLLGGPGDDSVPALRTLAVAPASPTRPLLAICPGAEYGPAKRWPMESFLAVARHFHARHNMRIVLLGAAADVPLAQDFSAQLPQAENRVGQTSLEEFMATLAGARLVLCNDSGAMHVASVIGVPTVAIFGSTEPQITGPLGPRTRVLRHHVPCSPCFLRECPIDFACMHSITPEMVIAAGEALLEAPQKA
jgi:heptosyltransferase-2